MTFPNPVERTDLPVPRKKWKYALSGVITLMVLFIAFLPQILSTNAGRRLIKIYLEGRYNAEVWVTGFKTSWFGPTRVSKFSLTDSEGRQIKFSSLESPISLGRLLTRNFVLGDATITDLHVEYVIDHGDGTSTFDRLPKQAAKPASQQGLVRGRNARAPLSLPELSGRITLKNASLVLTRGQVQEERQFRTAYQSLRFVVRDGSFDIQGLDRLWTCRLEGTVGPEDDSGTFALSGSLDLGENGRLDWANAWGEVQLQMKDLPNGLAPGAGPLAWLILPMLSAEDCGQLFGPRIEGAEVAMAIADGTLRFEKLELAGRDPSGERAWFAAKPVVKLTSAPRTLTLDGDMVFAGPLTPGVAAELACINPFLADFSGTGGRIDLKVRDLVLPLEGKQQRPSAKGEVSARDVPLTSGQLLTGDLWPRELTTQWQAVVGNVSWSPVLQMPGARFAVQQGAVSVAEHEMTIDGLSLSLAGRTTAAEKLEFAASLALPPALGERLDAAIGGTVQRPAMELSGAGAVEEAVVEHLIKLRQRKRRELLEKSSKQVEGLLETFDGGRRAQ